jgi:hypothetical protein
MHAAWNRGANDNWLPNSIEAVGAASVRSVDRTLAAAHLSEEERP